jgi:hypothetical protein
MFSAFFGNYLLNKGLVQLEDMKHVLDVMHTKHLKLGVLAINLGYMTAKEVENVHHKQAIMDKYFGEVAIEQGYLTEKQLEKLLSAQKSERLLLAQTLIEEGIMSHESFEEEIRLYKIEYGLNDDQFEAIKSGDVHVIATAFMTFEKKVEAQQFYIDFVTLFVKNLIRFVDTQVSIDRVQRIEELEYEHLISQYLVGEDTFFTAFGGSSEILLDLAEKYAETSFESFDDYAVDSCQEFLNVTTGLFAVNLSDQNIDYTLKPPTYVENALVRPQKTLYRIPVKLSRGTIYLIVGHLD